jgi:uncharacterized protein YndB with AHSA1/START domain
MISPAMTGVTTYTTPTDCEFVITRVVDAPRRIVFEAWTNPKYLPQWMTGPEGWSMPVCEIDLRPGGTWHYVWRKANGSEMSMTGLIREVAPPERLVMTEKWGPEWPETINTLLLSESGGQTTITLTVTYPTREARDRALETGMKDGMEASFTWLEKLLRTLV